METTTTSARQQEQHQHNIVRLCGVSESSCGYCQGKRSHLVNKQKSDSSSSYGLLVDRMSCKDYEILMNHGWRRSGMHLYKPDNWNSCCPALSIRLQVDRFQISKSQKRVLRSMERCLQNYHVEKETKQHKKEKEVTKLERIVRDCGVLAFLQHLTHQALTTHLKQTCDSVEKIVMFDSALCSYKIQKTNKQKHAKNEIIIFTSCCAAVAGRSKGKLNKSDLSLGVAKSLRELCDATTEWSFPLELVRLERHEKSGQILVTLKEKEEPNHNNNNRKRECPSDDQGDEGGQAMEGVSKQPPDVLGDWLESMGETALQPPYKLEIVTHPAQESALQPEVHKLYALYQHEIHGDPDPFATPTTNAEQTGAQQEEEEEEGDDDDASGTLEKAKQMLQREYGTKYSAEQVSRIQKSFTSFFRFLVESPLLSTEKNNTALPLGTFHQHYRVQGQLIAVGVVDVLPTGLSSVYAFYHPALSKHLALGKFAILKEIEFTQTSKLPFYYLGYYIESCQKMKYKADYRPSALLCPTHYEWVDAKEAQEILYRDSPERHCCTLYHHGESKKEHGGARVETIPLDVGASSIVTLEMLNPHGQRVVRPLLEEFLAHVGPNVSQRCIIKLV